MKSILITGCAGFLGSHLVDYYLAQGDEVVGLDNLSTGRLENVSESINKDNFSFIEHDITRALPESVTGKKYDLIFNMACPASPLKYQRLAMETLTVNSLGVSQLVNLSIKNKARLIHSSTSEVYGDPKVSPQSEDYWGYVNSYGPRSMYDEGKRYAEALIWTAQNKLGLNAGIARIFNTYGPRMAPDDGRVVSNLIVAALVNKPLTIYGDGNQTRSFCYVSDLIYGLVLLADSDEIKPVNLGNPNEFSIIQLSEKVLDLISSGSEVVYLERTADDPKQRKPDITRAKEVLGWEPTIDLRNGLIETINYFRES